MFCVSKFHKISMLCLSNTLHLVHMHPTLLHFYSVYKPSYQIGTHELPLAFTHPLPCIIMIMMSKCTLCSFVYSWNAVIGIVQHTPVMKCNKPDEIWIWIFEVSWYCVDHFQKWCLTSKSLVASEVEFTLLASFWFWFGALLNKYNVTLCWILAWI